VKDIYSRFVWPFCRQVNEHYLFHGTRGDHVTAIARDGLDSRLSSVGAQHGPGLYFAESSTKADQYTGEALRLALVLTLSEHDCRVLTIFLLFNVHCLLHS
jgi:hypothetical protein